VGVLIAWGQDIRRTEGRIAANIMDLALTVYYLFGLEIPKFVDGCVRKEIIKEGFLSRNKEKYTEKYLLGEEGRKSLAVKEEESIKRHLEELGYL
jgi:hypothetical protein